MRRRVDVPSQATTSAHLSDAIRNGPRIASSKLLPNKLTVTDAAALANLVAGGHNGANQHERAARTRGRSSGAVSNRRAG